MWGYAIIWALLSDRMKLVAYRVLDRMGAPDQHTASDTDLAHPDGVRVG